MQFRQPYQKTVYRPISFRWKLGELKTYYFPENWSWNWSYRHVEHSFDNSVNLLVARSLGKIDRDSEEELQHCDFLEENTHFGPPWKQKAGLRTKFFHRLSWKISFISQVYLQIHHSFGRKLVFKDWCLGHVECCFDNPAGTFSSRVRTFLLNFRKSLRETFFYKKLFFPQRVPWTGRIRLLPILPTLIQQSS